MESSRARNSTLENRPRGSAILAIQYRMTLYEQARQGTECRRSIAVERDIFAARRGIARRTAARRAISPREHRLTRMKSQRRCMLSNGSRRSIRAGCRRPSPAKSKTAEDEQRVSEAAARYCCQVWVFLARQTFRWGVGIFFAPLSGTDYSPAGSTVILYRAGRSAEQELTAPNYGAGNCLSPSCLLGPLTPFFVGRKAPARADACYWYGLLDRGKGNARRWLEWPSSVLETRTAARAPRPKSYRRRVVGKKLYVGNLSYNVKSSDLEALSRRSARSRAPK